MLECKDSRRHEHRHLFAVGSCFEGGPHSYFGLAESHIAADEPVHRHRTLHVVLHIGCRFGLVGRVLVEERSLQLVLHVSVGRIGKTFLLLAGGVQTNQVTRYVLHLVLGPLFEPFPGTRTESCYRRLRAFTTFVLADAVQVMN